MVDPDLPPAYGINDPEANKAMAKALRLTVEISDLQQRIVALKLKQFFETETDQHTRSVVAALIGRPELA